MINGISINRRAVLAGLGSALVIPSSEPFAAENACLLTPQATEGPYYFDPQLVRSDITEGGIGMPLDMTLHAVDEQCKPLAIARIDLWHADARGFYSGYDEQKDQTFMRGTQFADAQGLVRFQTVYPGWYRGRTTHMHFKVFVSDRDVLTGQLYFPEAISERVYTDIAPYNARKLERDTTNETDWLLRRAGEAGSIVSIREEGQKYAAAMTIGIAAA